MENMDKTTFSLDDDDEVVEEEVIDRDEEYDDDDDYDDEEYDDEEYDDDDGYDEEEEDYDDGYNDDYYDDRLNKVLDEIAEIKRGMAAAPSTVVQQQPPIQPMPPQYVYQPSAPPAGSEVVMYNEISRLRDELARNQSNLEMQKELTRLKDDMARDQRFTESQYAAEIKRLQDRIEDLQKNASSPQNELPPAQQGQARLEGGKDTTQSNIDFDKLLSINEAILRATRDSDARLQSEISHIKKDLESFPSSDDLNKAISSIKKATASANAGGVSDEAVNRIAADIAALKNALGEKPAAVSASAPAVVPVITQGGGSDINASELLRQLYEIKNLLGSTSTSTVKRTQTVLDLIADYKKVAFDVRSGDVSYKDKLSSVYSFTKKLSECNEPDALDLIEATNSLIEEIAVQRLDKKSFADIVAYYQEKGPAISSSVKESAERFFDLAEKVTGVELDEVSDYLPDLVAERNQMEDNRREADNEAALNKITEAMFDEERDDAAIRDMIARLTDISVGDVVELPLIAAPKSYKPAHAVNTDTVFGKIADVKAALENLQVSKSDEETAEDEEAEPSDEDSDGEEAQTESDVETLAADVVAAIDDLRLMIESQKTDATAADVLAAVDELKLMLESQKADATAAAVAANSDDALSSVLEEVRNNYIDISDRLVGITEQLAEEPTDAPVMTAEDKEKALSDLEYIHTKLDDYEMFINQIGDLRADILNVSNTIDFSEQYNSLVTEITTQFDKLYEDLSNSLIDSETNVINRINESSAVTDAVEAAKADILADTQAIKDAVFGVGDIKTDILNDTQTILIDTQSIRDSLVSVNDAVVNSPLNDAVEQLRADLSSFADLTAANVDVSTTDRQRLLDDVAFLREQAEAELAEKEQAAQAAENGEKTPEELEREKLYSYLDDLASRISLVATAEDLSAVKDDLASVIDAVSLLNYAEDFAAVKDDLAVVKEDLASVKDNSTAVLDAIAPVNDSISIVNDNIATISDDIMSVKDTATAALDAITPINDSISVVNDNIATVSADIGTVKDTTSATLDAIAPIADQLNLILEKLEPVESDASEVVEEEVQTDTYGDQLAEIRENLATILDTIPLFPQSDDVVTARDNTYSILDTLTLMPQNDDIVATRDNVATLLDSVNALSESLSAVTEAVNADDIATIRDNTAAILDAMPEGFAEDMAIVRDNTNTVLDTLASFTQTQEDVGYIRQKLDEEQADDEVGDSLANIMQDIGLILDKLEAYEQTAADNKQEIVDNVNNIKEEIHIKELDENISAAGIDDETRDKLVAEIAEIRERLNDIEGATQSINDVNATAFDGINAQLADIQSKLEAPVQNDSALAILDEINEKLNSLTENGVAVDATESSIADDIAAIKARLEGGVAVATDGEGAPVANNESLQAIIDELAVIKEKLDVDGEYDTIGEILSLREDVKAARIVDQSEVSSELEAIKNELAAISSESILDEIRAIRDEMAVISGGDGETPAATDDELNLVLNEIVSLRDEVFAFKDEVLNATAINEQPEAEQSEATANEDVATILDEITALRADQTALTGNIDELKDIISRRTTLAAESDSDADAAKAASNELNVVLGEIINLKNDIDRIEETIPTDRLDTITQQVEELRALLGDMQSSAPAQTEVETVDLAEIKQSIDNIALGTAQVDFSELAGQLDNINEALNELRLDKEAALATESGVAADSSLMGQFESLHAEIDELKAAMEGTAAPNVADEIAELRAEIAELRNENEQLRAENAETINNGIAELRDAIRDMTLSMSPVTTEAGDTSYAALIDEIRSLKDQVAAVAVAPSATLDENILKAVSDALAAQTETDMPLSAELADIRDEIAQLRSLTTVTAEAGSAAEVAAIRNELYELRQALNSPESMSGIAEDVSTIKSDVQILKEEPDLGVLNEILALRDEFQSLREEIEDVKAVASKSDREADESILNEVQSLRDQLFAISMANVNDSASGESNYESYNNIILDEISSLREQIETAGSSDDIRSVSAELAKMKEALDNREKMYEALSEKVDKLGDGSADSKILDEIASLRDELANSRDADLTTLNFMSEIAKLLERKNDVAVSSENDAVATEVAKLRAEIAALTERDQRKNETVASDESAQNLEESLSDLKDQLSEIAGIVETEKKPAKKTTKSTKGKTGAKKSTRKKSPVKRTVKADDAAEVTEPVKDDDAIVVNEPVAPVAEEDDDFETKLAEELAKLGNDDEMSIDPNGPITSDMMDIAEKLAKQVANKLVMQQLVEQLGDGGVSAERVDEILKDILPHEFNTVAINAQSDKVRKLANQLVIDKLRDRLNGKKTDGGDEE